MPRCAPISDEEMKVLSLKALKLLKSHGVHTVYDDYDKIREYNFVGYAHYYLREFWDESELNNKADVTIYRQLLEIDSKLGTSQSEQLRCCLHYSPRKDLIEVRNNL